VDGNTSYNCLVEWNDMSKSQSSVNFFALSLINTIPIISLVRKNYYLDKMPFWFWHFIQSKASTLIVNAQKISVNTTGIKYKFGIQVRRGIKNAINLDEKNGNNIWEEAVKTDLKQPKDYQTFIVHDSGKIIPTSYQKIPYNMLFDVKYDLSHKARLVAQDN
jgi:hypothetical protein